MELTRLAICIPVHGFSEALANCLKSIDRYIRSDCQQKGIECHLSISNSGDDINIREYWHGSYEIIKVPSNYYWGASVRVLFETSRHHRSSHLLLMNHDILLMPNSWEKLVTAIPQHPSSVLSAVSVVLNTEVVENAGFRYTNKSIPFSNPYLNEHITSLPINNYEVDALNGRFVLFPTDAANPDFLVPHLIPHYFADTVLSVKARRSGFPLLVIPSSVVYADRSDDDSKKKREKCDTISGVYNCLFKPYSYRYIWGNFWGQILLVDNFISGFTVSVKYTGLRIAKSVFELLGVIKTAY